ncbi:MAG: DHA2 family efflux MFS transporter permease subunit, partial [Candidatus Omnitrophica bacterium]|nr:DHA2 family efflux MFS transporter permease subunit [Candidatus Omnitrophota bacterium]
MNKWLVALTVIIPTMLEVIDTSVVNVSLGHIRGSLSAGVDEATWAITSYLVSNAIVIPMAGWLARFFGRKRYLIFSIGLFTVSSFFCGCAWSLSSLIFFRVLQGLGGGGLQPLSMAILLETFPVAEHGIATAIFGVGVMFAPVAGPILGGWTTDNWSWHWIFYINIPIGILSMMAVAMVIKDPHYLQKIKKGVDYWGIGLIAVGLGALQIVLDKGQQEDWFNSTFIVKLAIVSVVALVLFVVRELRAEEPIVNLHIFKNTGFAAGNAIQFFTFGALFGSIVLLPIYLQQFMGYTALLAGLALAPGGIATLVVMPIAGKLLSKVNPKGILISGLLITAYSCWILTQLTAYVTLEFIFWARIVMGAGLGFAFIALTNLILSQIKKEEMGNA